MQGYKHLCETFELAEKTHPDLMEPYSNRVAEAASAAERMEIMVSGLRETIRQRYPMAAGRWPGLPVPAVAPQEAQQ